MTYEEAIESRVSIGEACAEMQRHGFFADYDDGEFFDATSGETVAMIAPDGTVSGADVLEWLGY